MTNTVPSFACLYTVIPCMSTSIKSYQFADKSSSDQTFSEINRPGRDSKIHYSFPNSPSKKKRITYILASTGYLYNNSERISAAKMNRTSQHTRFYNNLRTKFNSRERNIFTRSSYNKKNN